MIIKIVIYVVMQIVGMLLFKWGSSSGGRWLAGFLLGNLVVFGSTWFLMELYKQMNPNVAMGVCAGTAFLLAQIALALVYQEHINCTQWSGIALITCGIAMVCISKDIAAISVK